MKIKSYISFALFASLVSSAIAQDGTMNPHMGIFLAALKDGKATEAVPDVSMFQPAIAELKRKTGNNGDIMISATLIKRFTQQKNCGRIEFHLTQPTSGQSWPNIGGQFNLCEQGTPPLMYCPPNKNKLVAPDTVCANGNNPIETPEVAQAIKDALTSGSAKRATITQKFN